MTTFEITIIVLLAVIVVLLAWHCTLTRNNNRLNQTKELKRHQQVESLLSHLKTMRERSILLLAISDRLEIHSDNCNKRLAELTDTVNKMHRNLCVEIADKMVDRIYPDKESMNKIDWDKLSKEQQDEFLKRLILPNYDKPTQPIYTPCYAPNGICTNPHMDCISCPKRGTGGTWSTSTNISKNDE